MKFSPNASPILLATIFLAACGAKTSDEQQVRALIDEVETAAEARDTSDVLEHVADTYADSSGLDKTQLRDFLRGYFLVHPKLELVVNIESLEFPVDGLAQAVISVTTVELTDPNRQQLKVEFRRSEGAWQVARADRLVR
jgi:RNase adaptor protein for sRNA GlmZ degradation